MKTILIAITLLLFVLLGSSYLLIPQNLPVGKTAYINANGKSIYRSLTDTTLLKKMAEAHNVDVTANELRFGDVTFQFKEQLTDNISVPIVVNGKMNESYFSIIKINPDSSAIEWRTQLHTGINPFKKIQQYFIGKEIKASMTKLLSMIQNFSSSTQNVYEFDIKREKVTDTLLISTKSTTTGHPTTDDYYSLIHLLENYAEAQGVNAVNYPMLHIERIDSNQYETMVALPINKKVTGKGDIVFKKMVAGNILTTEVKGGNRIIEQGFIQLNNYVTDYNMVSPAISFQSLVTNRQLERDTSKWVSKLHTPVF